MTSYVTKEELTSELRTQTDEIVGLLQTFMTHADERFNKAESEMAKINSTFAKVESEIIDLKKSHDKLINTMDSFISQITDFETERAARDQQFDKLLAWARKVSKKTGIPLENL